MGNPVSIPTERRYIHDRRRVDMGPPAGGSERRLRPERRLPTLEEYECSEQERYPGIEVLTYERGPS